MSVKNERSLTSQTLIMDALIQSLGTINIEGTAEDRIRRYTQVIPECNVDIQYTGDLQKSCFKMSCANICRAVSCCGVIRCCGSDNYYVSIQNGGEDSSVLTKKISRRQLSQKTNQLTNACFFLELCNMYGKEDFPVLFTWTLMCLPSGARHYWENWIPTSEEPLERKRADIFKETMQEAFSLMRTLRIEKLKKDFMQGLTSPLMKEAPPQTFISTSSGSSDSEYKTPTGGGSFEFLLIASEDIQAESVEEKFISTDKGKIKFDINVIIHDVIAITGCSLNVAQEIATSIKMKIPPETTCNNIWDAVKAELASRNLTALGYVDDEFISILTECSVEKVTELPVKKIPVLMQKQSMKKKH